VEGGGGGVVKYSWDGEKGYVNTHLVFTPHFDNTQVWRDLHETWNPFLSLALSQTKGASSTHTFHHRIAQRTPSHLLDLTTLPLPQGAYKLTPILLRTPHAPHLRARSQNLVAKPRDDDRAHCRQRGFLEGVLDSGGHLSVRVQDLDGVQVWEVLHAFEEGGEDGVGFVAGQGDVDFPAIRALVHDL
jgi:hypothetical protein